MLTHTFDDHGTGSTRGTSSIRHPMSSTIHEEIPLNNLHESPPPHSPSPPLPPPSSTPPFMYTTDRPYTGFTTLIHRFTRHYDTRHQTPSPSSTSFCSSSQRRSCLTIDDLHDLEPAEPHYPSHGYHRDTAIDSIRQNLSYNKSLENDQRVALSPRQEMDLELARLGSAIERLNRGRLNDQACEPPSKTKSNQLEKIETSLSKLDVPTLSNDQRYIMPPHKEKAIFINEVCKRMSRLGRFGDQDAILKEVAPIVAKGVVDELNSTELEKKKKERRVLGMLF